MKSQIEARLATLRGELESGQQVLADLEQRHAEVTHTMQRISGAIQVLEELLAGDGVAADHAA
ncbi:hypothetical protein GCM10007860_33680 [Chitiniphilus shinanonensis]|uniref:Uncharacterized protein n=1 Tax=Chitiniphilus shinanonensis TaxID=553088 RepID=A0ABQ6C225_9NEIS|nr:hypothetical protein [Chitiniphilus shinanonensis]GLS06198.1 hypothetical protein GCM10007860_33680 [Chitiniphilus shinanonensis]